MRPMIQSSLILAGTLALGMVLGVLLAGSLAQRRAHQVDTLREREGFVRHMERTIEPRDEEQRRIILPILEQTARANGEIIRTTNDRLRMSVQEMIAELEPHLDPGQMDRLLEMGQLPDPFGGPRMPPGNQRPPPRGEGVPPGNH